MESYFTELASFLGPRGGWLEQGGGLWQRKEPLVAWSSESACEERWTARSLWALLGPAVALGTPSAELGRDRWSVSFPWLRGLSLPRLAWENRAGH